MSYAQARLWIGISAVGFNVLLATGVVIGSQASSTEFLNSDAALWVLLVAYVIWMVPFDFLGGWWLPRRYGRSQQALFPFIGDWLRGVLLQSIVFVVCGASLLWAARTGGLTGSMIMLAVLFMLLLTLRPVWLRWLSASDNTDHESDVMAIEDQVTDWGISCGPIVFRRSPTTGFTGSIVGLIKPQIILPVHWRTLLSNEEIAALAARRSITLSTGSRRLGLIFAIAWTLLAFIAGNWFAGTIERGPQTAIDLLHVTAATTLWNFLGLLLLPSVSRFASRRLDGMAVGSVPNLVLQAAQEKVDRVQDNEVRRPKGIEFIFHPVPSVALRQQRELTSLTAVPWHVARQALYLSWAVCSPLARAVHCNAGQSLLWICPPTD